MNQWKTDVKLSVVPMVPMHGGSFIKLKKLNEFIQIKHLKNEKKLKYK